MNPKVRSLEVAPRSDIPYTPQKLPVMLAKIGSVPFDAAVQHVPVNPATHAMRWIEDVGTLTDGQPLQIAFAIQVLDPASVPFLTSFDRLIYTAICGLYAIGHRIITAHQICRTISSSPHPNGAQLQEIRKSVTKLFSTNVVFKPLVHDTHTSWPPHERTFHMLDGSVGHELRPELLSAITVRCPDTDGIWTLHLTQEPSLFSFVRTSWEQIAWVDANVITVPLRLTELNCALTAYLLRDLHLRQHHGAHNYRLRLSTIYTHLGSTAASRGDETSDGISAYSARRHRRTIRKNVPIILDYWQSIGFIQNGTVADNAIEIQLLQQGNARAKR